MFNVTTYHLELLNARVCPFGSLFGEQHRPNFYVRVVSTDTKRLEGKHPPKTLPQILGPGAELGPQLHCVLGSMFPAGEHLLPEEGPRRLHGAQEGSDG